MINLFKFFLVLWLLLPAFALFATDSSSVTPTPTTAMKYCCATVPFWQSYPNPPGPSFTYNYSCPEGYLATATTGVNDKSSFTLWCTQLSTQCQWVEESAQVVMVSVVFVYCDPGTGCLPQGKIIPVPCTAPPPP